MLSSDSKAIRKTSGRNNAHGSVVLALLPPMSLGDEFLTGLALRQDSLAGPAEEKAGDVTDPEQRHSGHAQPSVVRVVKLLKTLQPASSSKKKVFS